MGPQNIQDRSRYIQDAWDFVEYCNGPVTTIWGKRRAENGHPAPYRVKYWEIDNEVWSENPDNYVQAIRDFSVAMKAVDPSISLIACGSGDFGHRWGQGDIAIIDQVADMVDFLSIHRYESPDHFDTGPERAELFWGQLAERIAQSKNPRLRLFVSEWNAQSTDWRTGLYAGGELNAFESNPIVGMASPALWLRHVTAPSWDNAFINFDQSGWFPAPNYVVMKLYREHYAPQLLRITGAPDALSAVATRTADGHTIVLKLVNTSAKPMEIRLKLSGSLHPRKVEMFTVAPDSLTARNTMEQLDAVRTIESTLPAPDAGNDEKIAISRWSVNVVVLTTP
jgi:alpha-N-arabinofuranosidase